MLRLSATQESEQFFVSGAPQHGDPHFLIKDKGVCVLFSSVRIVDESSYLAGTSTY